MIILLIFKFLNFFTEIFNKGPPDAVLFLDIGNIWGVDYDTSIDDSDEIRSSVGIGIDWFSVIGPINFSLTEAISKADTDITETFRFNIGTTF